MKIEDINWKEVIVTKVTTMTWDYEGQREKSLTYQFHYRAKVYVLCLSLESNKKHVFKLYD